jgi:putative intracellular protease/amidase
MSNVLEGKRIAILATDGVERRELEEPQQALRQAGGDTELLSLKMGTIDARDHDLEPAGEFRVDRKVGDAAVEEFDALVIPGGTVNADKLRLDRSAIAFVHDFVESGKPVGVICHGPWALVEAGVVSESAYRPPQRGRPSGRRGGGRRRQPDLQPITGRSTGVLQGDRGQVLRRLATMAPARLGPGLAGVEGVVGRRAAHVRAVLVVIRA